MSGRSPEQLAREVRDVMHSSVRDPAVDRALAALAELQAQAEAGQRYEQAMWLILSLDHDSFDTAFRYEQNIRKIAHEAVRAAAAPSPADQEEA